MPEIIRVGMGEYAIAHAPGEIVTLGLGSCVSVSFYDPSLRLGGVVHVMLPDSGVVRENINPAKFADTAVPFMVREMEKHGASRHRLIIKAVGGAQMFSAPNREKESVGFRNVTGVEVALEKLGLSLSAKSVGGNTGKSVSLDLDSGELRLRTVQVESAQI